MIVGYGMNLGYIMITAIILKVVHDNYYNYIKTPLNSIHIIPHQ